MTFTRRKCGIPKLIIIAFVTNIMVAAFFFLKSETYLKADEDMGRAALRSERQTYVGSLVSPTIGVISSAKPGMSNEAHLDKPVAQKNYSGAIQRTGATVCPTKEFLSSERVNKIGSYPVRKTFLAIGIATITRPQRDYLLQTLTNIVESFTEEDKKDVHIVVFLADFNETAKMSQRKALAEIFQQQASKQIFHVIEAPKEFYPSLDSLKKKFKDSPERIRWRSKQNIDYSFLMCYCKDISSYYLHLEDDIKVSPSFFPKLRDIINSQEESWKMLDASAQGHVGKVYQSGDLGSAASLFYVMYDEMPVDWLMLHWRQMTSESSDPKKHFLHTAGLFQHLGTHSSLDGKIIKSKERYFDEYDHKYLGLNPEAEVTSTLKAHVGQPQDAYNKGIGYFWAKNARKDDDIMISFGNPVHVQDVSVETGSYLAPKDILKFGSLEFSKDFGNCRWFRTVALFQDGSVHVRVNKTVTCLRVALASAQTWVFVREINVWTK